MKMSTKKHNYRTWYIAVILALIIQVILYSWFTRYWK